MMSFNYDTNKDAHKQSNYAKWKRGQFITDVQVDLSKLGVPNKKIKALYKGIVYCFKTNTPFALYCRRTMKSVVVFMPELLMAKQGAVTTKYKDLNQMLNAIKLISITNHDIFFEQKQPKQISGRSNNK
jgi:hypothetical protein